VLPGLIAKNLCREVGTMLAVAPAIGLANALAAFVLANYYDYPPGQLATAMLAALLVVAWGLRYLRRLRMA
jgi:ABC-type Mn2+/Zn2+ transport system permease subunit